MWAKIVEGVLQTSLQNNVVITEKVWKTAVIEFA